MAITCTLYKNTGFTPTNLPYDIDALEAAATSKSASVTVDIVQIFNLASVAVKAFEADVMNCDYVHLHGNNGDAYYVVVGYAMSSLDVAQLELAEDSGLTAGGWGNITINSGTWNRAYDQNGGEMIIDGLMQFSEYPKFKYMLNVAGEWTPDPESDYQLIASIVDLQRVPEEDDNVAYTYDDEAGEVHYAFIPKPVTQYTTIWMNAPEGLGGDEGSMKAVTSGYTIYDFSNPQIKAAVEKLRAYGYESAIIGAWRVPYSFIDPPGDPTAERGTILLSGRFEQISTARLAVGPYYFTFMNAANLYEGETAKKLSSLLRHTDTYKIGVISATTGAKIERRRTEITGWLYTMLDPRAEGAPYFIMQDRVLEDDDTSIKGERAYLAGQLQKNAIQGSAWNSLPIIYEGASGRQLNYMKLSQSERFAQENYAANYDNAMLAGMGGMFYSGLTGANASMTPMTTVEKFEHLKGNTWYDMNSLPGFYDATINSPAITGLGARNAMGMIGAGIGTLVAAEGLTRRRIQDAKTAMAEYVINNKLVAPQMTGQTIEGLQQYFGNLSVVYAIYPTETDLLRFGAIAAMFGVACNRPADSHINKPKTACYYSGSGIQCTVGRNVPKSVRENVSELLNIGVRLWAGKPRRLTANDWVNR